MRIVFSKDRPAQLDLLLRSLQRYAPAETTHVIRAWTWDYKSGYDLIAAERPDVTIWVETADWPFHTILDNALRFAEAYGETVTFFCDDDVLYRAIDEKPTTTLAHYLQVLTFSLRLAANPRASWSFWDWTKLPPHDHGYPGSIDGHTFRTEDLRVMLAGQTIENPLMLETILAKRVHALAAQRPLMACYPEQKLVGLDVNTVAPDKRRPSGKTHPQSPEELNRRFLAGERISLDALDLDDVDGCLVEREFVWEPAC